MSVTFQEIQNWSASGTKDAMARTYAAVQAALTKSVNLQNHDIEIFLQGSYANATNIRGDSDVDIVVMLKSSWNADKSLLTEFERSSYDKDHSAAAYGAVELRKDIVDALQSYFGNVRVKPGNKAIRVDKKDSYVDADVVPAIQHRIYTSYDSLSRGRYIEGTKLHPQTGGTIVNFPKAHKKNGKLKHESTNENFKPAVRQLKQLKRRAVASGNVSPKKTPGYLIECLTYNVPNTKFVDNHHTRLTGVLGWLCEADFNDFMSVDGIHKLFQTDPGKFSPQDAKVAILKMVEEVVA